MNKIMYQEIDIKLNVIFLQTQLRRLTTDLDGDIKYLLTSRNGYIWEENPIIITELESSMTNMHVRFTTSINAKYDEFDIGRIIGNRVKELLSWGVLKIDVMSLREEAEIYGNN